MTKTNIEQFNISLKNFINNIITLFPDYTTVLTEYYSKILNEDSDEEKFLKRFIFKLRDHKHNIANENDRMFESDQYILKHVNFKEIWKSDIMNIKNKKAIWKHLQTLYLLTEVVNSKNNELIEVFKNFNNSDNNLDIDNSNLNIDEDIINMFKKLGNKTNLEERIGKGKDTGGGLIGQLAAELSKDINIEELGLNLDEHTNMDTLFSDLMTGKNSAKFMNLIQTVGTTIQTKIQKGEIDANSLLSEAQNVMTDLENNK